MDRSIRTLAGFAMAALLAASLPAGAQIFLKIDQIRGESVDDRHKGEIEVQSLQFGLAPKDARSIRGCPTDIVISKMTDSASAPLIAAATVGFVFPKVTFTFTKRGDRPFDYLVIELTNAAVTSISTSSGGSQPNESIAFGFASGTYKYTPQDDKGGPGAPITANLSRANC